MMLTLKKSSELKILLINLFVYFSFLLFLTHLNIEYQDSWILDGILLQFIIVVLIFIFSIMCLSDIRYIGLLCSFFIVLLNLIPGLKYGYFLDTGDSATHYMLVKHILEYGFPEKNGAYSNIPGFHILLAGYTLIANCSLNLTFKYLLPICSIFYPLMIYFTINQFEVNYAIKKYTIISSVFFIICNYIIYGTSFGSMILFLIIALFLKDTNSFSISILIILSIFSLVTSHFVTSFLFPIFLLGPLFFSILFRFDSKYSKMDFLPFTRSKKLYPLIIVIFLVWLMYQANYVFDTAIENIYKQFILSSQCFKEPLPAKSLQFPLYHNVKYSYIYSRDLVLLLNCIIGLFLIMSSIFYNRCKSMKNLFNYLFLTSVVLVIDILLLYSFISHFGGLEYSRYINYGVFLAPFFMGIALEHYDKMLLSHFHKYMLK